MISLDDPTTLSSLFHLNSEPWLNDGAYKRAAGPQELKVPESILAEVPLPPHPASTVADLARRRSSCRVFSPRPLPLEMIGALLAGAYGLVREAPENGYSYSRRTVPSAGGLYPLELYAFVRRTEGTADGLYHYDVPGHALQMIAGGDLFPQLESIFYTYAFMREANLVIVLAAVFGRTQKKYGPRGYRYILLEAGHAGQNICLRAVELGLSTLCMGGFVDSTLNALLGLDVPREGAVYTIAVGYDGEERR